MRRNLIFQLIISIGTFSVVLVHSFTAPAPSFSRRAITRDVPTSLFMAQDTRGLTLYPVISRIASKNWTGSCKYVGEDLIHQSKLKLTAGMRYDIDGRNVTLSSYLRFPNGQTREVVMVGSRDSAAPTPVITFRSIEEGGPIRMLLTEVGSNTILINEVEEATGKTILTSSTSLMEGIGGDELVQVSHEVGEGGIEGHQIWRLMEAKYTAPLEADAARNTLSTLNKEGSVESASSEDPIEFNDFNDFRDTTGR